ncbi:MAG: hypothetical protein EPO07_19260 [Verrucomicrobia bacterium]|nr:MAG: hypothetical protein EPO07_19260 [Verrucomicrobiota bacterium]
MIKLISEYRGYAEVTNRRPKPKRPMLYLIQLREQSAHGQAEKRRLLVEIAEQAQFSAPLPVKINVVKAGSASLPVAIR